MNALAEITHEAVVKPDLSVNPVALFITPALPSFTGSGLAQRSALSLEVLVKLQPTLVLVAPQMEGEAMLARVEQGAEKLPNRENYSVLDGSFELKTHHKLIAMVESPAERVEAFRRLGEPSACAPFSEAALNACAAALNGFKISHCHVFRSYCAGFGARLIDRLFDGRDRRLLMSLDLDEDDAAFYSLLADHLETKNTPDISHKVAWNRAEAKAYRNEQAGGFAAYDVLVASSKLEADRLERTIGRTVEVVANVSHCPVRAPRLRTAPEEGRSSTLLMVGNFGYIANQDGLRWFLRSIWPAIIKQTNARLRVVGMGLQKEFVAKYSHLKDVEFYSDVDSVLPFYADADLAIAPLRLGAGTRIKLLEAALLGVPFVATPLAVEGLDLVDQDHALLPEDADAFAQAVVQALQAPDQAYAMAVRAQKQALKTNSKATVMEALQRAFDQARCQT